MATQIPIPKLGQSEETVTIQKWRVKEGDKIKKGDVLFEVETDKAVLEVESQFEGTLLKIVVPAGVEVPVMTIGAIVGAPGEAVPAIEAPKPAAKAAAPAPAAAPSAPKAAATVAPAASAPAASAPAAAPVAAPVASAPSKVRPSPRARVFAKDFLIDLDKVPGSGGGVGRVTEKDVKSYLESSGYFSKKITPTALSVAKAEKLELLALSGSGEGGRITLADVKDAVSEKPKQLSTMRKVIAKRLADSKKTIPHFYVTVSVDMGAVAKKRAALKAQGIQVSVNVFVVKAVALALKEIPSLNAECDGNVIKFKSKVNVGVAVSLENGLVVPVIRNADKKAIDELQAEIAEIADKARAGKISPDDMKGGTFTISNMGMLNVENFGAIINPGESGILAVSSTIPTPAVAEDGKTVVVKQLMKITLSADHRAVDGSEGAKFVNAVKMKLEDVALWDSLI